MDKQKTWMLDALLEAYEQDQKRTRGLRPRTLRGYQHSTRPFLRAMLGEDPIDVTRLSPANVVTYISSLKNRYRPSTIRVIGTALRSLLRYFRVQGLCEAPLEEAIPTVACWKQASLPRGLREEQLERLFASLGRSSLCGLRDRAIVVCLATLGLRPGEVAQLCLEDIDWRSGTLHLRTRKTRRGSVLPLPLQAGLAIVEYLQEERPHSPAREVFLRHSSIRKGEAISAGIVTGAVVRALKRAGIDSPIAGAYVLRHTVATRMVQQGTRLKEIADFLGHRTLDTTTLYAKVDLAALRNVALPCPQVPS